MRGFISYELNGNAYKISSDFTKAKNVILPYDRIYEVYCDRSEQNDTHPYDAGDGTFGTTQDLNALRKILSATLNLEIRNGSVKDTKENKYYKSLYVIKYYDY